MTGVDYIKVFRDKKGEYRFGAYAANHEEVTASGESFKHLDYAERKARELFPHARVLVTIDPDPED